VGPGNHVLDGGPDPPWEGQIFGGEWASHCKVYGHSMVVCAKTAEPIGMPFGLRGKMGRRNRVGWGSIGAEGRCHGNQFCDAICYNWLWCLIDYNFGCMIASDMQFDSRGGFSGSSYPMKT